MKPRIENIEEKIFVGMSQEMSLVENKTFLLFSTFMPRRKEIQAAINETVYDLKVYPNNYFSNFNPTTSFTKWALFEVHKEETIPEGMNSFSLAAGKYAVFSIKGHDPKIFEHIFMRWLPEAGYSVDDRPHFDVMGEKYKRNDPDSESEIWIPIH